MLTAYSPRLTQYVASKGIHLLGKSGARFLEAATKFVVDEFHVAPPLPVKRFMSPGYVERKILATVELVERCKDLSRHLAKKSREAVPPTTGPPSHLEERFKEKRASQQAYEQFKQSFLQLKERERKQQHRHPHGEEIATPDLHQMRNFRQQQIATSGMESGKGQHQYAESASSPHVRFASPVAQLLSTPPEGNKYGHRGNTSVEEETPTEGSFRSGNSQDTYFEEEETEDPLMRTWAPSALSSMSSGDRGDQRGGSFRAWESGVSQHSGGVRPHVNEDEEEEEYEDFAHLHPQPLESCGATDAEVDLGLSRDRVHAITQQVLSQLTFTVEALGKRVEELSANFGARLTVLENRVTMMGSDVQSMQQVVFRNGPPSSGPSTTTLSSGAGSGGGHSRRFTAEQDSSTTSRSASARSSVDSFSRRSEHKVSNTQSFIEGVERRLLETQQMLSSLPKGTLPR